MCLEFQANSLSAQTDSLDPIELPTEASGIALRKAHGRQHGAYGFIIGVRMSTLIYERQRGCESILLNA